MRSVTNSLRFLLVAAITIGLAAPASIIQAQDDPARNCTGAAEWFKGTMRRTAEYTPYAEQFVNDVQPVAEYQEVPSFDTASYLLASAEIKRLQAEQVGSNPPPAAEVVNSLLAERFDHLAAAFDLISQVNGDEDQDLAEEASAEINEATNLGARIVIEMRSFIDDCGLGSAPLIFQEMQCFRVSELKSTDWYKGMLGMVIYVTSLEASGVQAVEDANWTAVRDTIQRLYEAADDLEKEIPPQGGHAYQDAAHTYILASAELFSAILEGTDSEIDEALEAYEVATQDVNDVEASLFKPCDDLLLD